jgi:succinate dehydrogenase/fumarate reductase flavoprotein subunit
MLEGLVFGIRTVRAAIRCLETHDWADGEEWTPPISTAQSQEYPAEELATAKDRLRDAMWRYVGLVRTEEGMRHALKTLNELYARYGHPPARRDAIELANMIECAWLITRSALERRESRGAHHRSDFPEGDEDWRFHLVLSGKRDNLKVERVAVH